MSGQWAVGVEVYGGVRNNRVLINIWLSETESNTAYF